MHTGPVSVFLLAGVTLSKLDYNYTTPKRESIADKVAKTRASFLQSKTRGHVENATIHEMTPP